jgi:protein-disulfide isomerase
VTLPASTPHAPPRTGPAHPGQDVVRIKKAWLFTASLALVCFALGGLTVYLLNLGAAPAGEDRLTPIVGGAPAAAPGAAQSAINFSRNPAIGPDDAPVTLVEFSDFYCIYCKSFHDQTLQGLLAKYGTRIRYVYRDFPSDGGQQAAEAASCASDQGAYWAYHNALFSDPHSYSSVDQFASLAQNLSLNPNEFRDCVASGKHRDEVMRDYQAGLSYGVRGTPTFFVNGIPLIGAQPIASFERVIDQQLKS